MATVVVENTVDSILADARNDLQVAADAQAAAAKEGKTDAPAANDGKGAETPSGDAETPKAEAAKGPELDDIEGEDGLTPRQKREFTESMLKTLGKKHGLQKAAEEFATDQYNQRVLAERRAEAAEREAAELKARTREAPKVDPEAGKPQRDKFENEQVYQDALVDWRVDQRLKERQAEDEKRQNERAQAELSARLGAKVDRAAELVPDYREVTGAVDVPVPAIIGGAMQESELFAEIGYYFAKNPAELERLSELTPAKALVEFGKIESKLQPFSKSDKSDAEKVSTASPAANGEAPSQKTGSAPSPKPRPGAPIKPITVTSSQVDKPESQMTAKEALAAYQKRQGINLERRKRH
jgi:hypothetical protein